MTRIGLFAFLVFSLSWVGRAQTRPISDEPQKIFYQIYVETFQDGSLRDGAGDFAGLQARLGYLKDLGVGAVLLMPVFEGAGMGYNPDDYFVLRPDYGASNDIAKRQQAFEQMVREAHRLGLRIYIDSPINHISTVSKWFKSSAARAPGFEDFFVWVDHPLAGWMVPWDPRTGPDDVFHYNSDRKQYFYGLFGWGMPDLNHRSKAVQNEMHRFFDYWTDLGVDGFRIDAAKHLLEADTNVPAIVPENLELLKSYLAAARARHPGTSFLLEVWSGHGEIDPFLPESGDVAFDFPYMETLRDSLKHDHPWALRNTLSYLAKSSIAPGHRIVFMGNHDVPRIRTELGDERERVELGFALTLTLPYAPLIYYGDEIYMPGRYIRATLPGEETHNEVCTPMAWSSEPNAGFADPSVSLGDSWNRKLHDGWKDLNVSSELRDPKSLLNFVKALTHLRQQMHYTNRTKLVVDDSNESDPLLRYAVFHDDGTCLSGALNFSTQAQPARSKSFAGCESVDDALSARASSAGDSFRLDAHGFWLGLGHRR